MLEFNLLLKLVQQWISGDVSQLTHIITISAPYNIHFVKMLTLKALFWFFWSKLYLSQFKRVHREIAQ